MQDKREAQLAAINSQIIMSLENCTCLGRDAYGRYIENLTESLMTEIKNYDPMDKLVKSLPFQGRDCEFESR